RIQCSAVTIPTTYLSLRNPLSVSSPRHHLKLVDRTDISSLGQPGQQQAISYQPLVRCGTWQITGSSSSDICPQETPAQ
ncbi:hypothetical protein JQN64_26265, partial [Escherichia coli]|nr:hypothetical protein [Escherichia coli]